jgi:hypothetical protein
LRAPLSIGEGGIGKGGGEVLDCFVRVDADGFGISTDVGAAIDAARPARAVATLETGKQGGRHFRAAGDGFERNAAAFTLSPEAIAKRSPFAYHGCCSSRERAWASQSLLS